MFLLCVALHVVVGHVNSDHHTNINHTPPFCECSLIPSGPHTQTIGISAASLNPVWDGVSYWCVCVGGVGDLKGGGLVRLQTAQPLLHGGWEGVHFFPGKKNREVYSADWADTIGAFFGVLMGCGLTMAEGAPGGAATGAFWRWTTYSLKQTGTLSASRSDDLL